MGLNGYSRPARRTTKWSAILPAIFSRGYVTVLSLLAIGVVCFLAWHGYLSLVGDHAKRDLLSILESSSFVVVVVLSLVGVVLVMVNWYFVLLANIAEQRERGVRINSRSKLMEGATDVTVETARRHPHVVPSSMIAQLLTPPHDE